MAYKIGYYWILEVAISSVVCYHKKSKDPIKKEIARSSERGLVREMMKMPLYLCVTPSQAEHITHFQFLSFIVELNTEASVLHRFALHQTSLQSRANEGVSYPTLNNNPAYVSAGPPHILFCSLLTPGNSSKPWNLGCSIPPPTKLALF